jgi:hypothetical protein
MKVILFLLIPVIIFSQTPDYPDTLYLKTGQVYSCLITKIDENMVKLIYMNNMPTSAGLTLVDKIYLEQFNIIYENDSFTSDINKLNEFVVQRKINLQSRNDQLIPTAIEYSSENKFSFGVFLVPNVNPDIHIYFVDPYYGIIKSYTIDKIESSFESQFSIEISPTLWVTLNVGYGSSYIKERNEYFRTSPYDTTREGSEFKYDMDFFNFNIGLKYYFTKLVKNRVSPYFQVGIGKKIAFVDTYEKNLYPDPFYQIYINDNESEYLEDINSPFYAYIGFGVEYFFNNSLSLNANMQLNYLTFSGEYKYNYSDTYNYNYKRTTTQKMEYSEITKRVGLGLNFYF